MGRPLKGTPTFINGLITIDLIMIELINDLCQSAHAEAFEDQDILAPDKRFT